MDDYGVEKITVLDNFSKFGWTVPLENIMLYI